VVSMFVLRRVLCELLLLFAVNSFLFANSFVILLFSFLANSMFLFNVDLLFIFVIDCLQFFFGQLFVEFF
jgi:hypothetical protein